MKRDIETRRGPSAATFGLVVAAMFAICHASNAAPVSSAVAPPDAMPIRTHSSVPSGHGLKCATEPGHAPNLGCTKMVEYYRKQIRRETEACKVGKIDADDCASALKDYDAEIKELSYSPVSKVAPSAQTEPQSAHETNCHAPEPGQVQGAGCARLVEMYRESLRGEIFECDTANIPADVCARVLPYFKARLTDLGYSLE